MKRNTSKYRRKLKARRIYALRVAKKYEKPLLDSRTKELKRVLAMSETTPIDEWIKLPNLIDEKYMAGILKGIYYNVGKKVSKEVVNDFLGRKADDIWDKALAKWLAEHAGEKITLMSYSFKKWMQNEIQKVVDSRGVEEITLDLYKSVTQRWDEVSKWQVRRIVQTESLTASSVASDISVRELGIPFVKVWASSGLQNSRPDHQFADGQQVDMNEPFIVGGEQLMFPHDSSLGASAGNIVNCACSCIQLPKQ